MQFGRSNRLSAARAVSLTAALILLSAASPRGQRPPEIAPSPPPLAAPEPETGSPTVASAPSPLDPVPTPPAATVEKSTRVRTDQLRLYGLMDRDVVGVDKLDIGHVIDVLVDPNGQPQALLVETGGFLGVGNRRIAIAWAGTTFPDNKPGGPIRTTMTVDQVRSAPAFIEGGPVTVAVGAVLPAPTGPETLEVAPPPPPLAPLLDAASAARSEATLPIAEPPPPLPAQRLLGRTR